MSDKRDISIGDMQKMQKELREAHKGEWNDLEPSQAKDQLLYLVEEVGEVIAIMKKKPAEEIMRAGAVRDNLCTELCDVLMYFNDVLLCFDISPGEIAEAYVSKHLYNTKRDYVSQAKELYTKKPETF